MIFVVVVFQNIVFLHFKVSLTFFFSLPKFDSKGYILGIKDRKQNFIEDFRSQN